MAEETASTPGARAWLLLVAVSLPMVALSIDANGVVVLLPAIGRDLGAEPSGMSAVVTISSIAFAAPLLLIGRLAGPVGIRRMLLGGVAAFIVASALCASTQTYAVLIGGRAIQGIAAACCFATSLAVLATVFSDDRLPFAIGIWAALGGVGSAVGPLVAGAVFAIASWRVFFGINVVILSVGFVVLLSVTPRSIPADTTPIRVGRLLGLTGGLVLVFAALQNASDGGFLSALVIAPLLGGVIIMIITIRGARSPLIAAAVTRATTFRLGTAEATLSNWGSGVLMVLVPAALQANRGLSVLAAGLVFLAFSATFAVGGALTGRFDQRIGGTRTLALGSALLAGGLLALGITGIEVPLAGLLAILAVAGFGNGLVYSGSTSYGLTEIDDELAAEASALLNMLRVLGMVLAISISETLVYLIDGDRVGAGDAGLRVSLLVAAVITAVGVPISRTRSRPLNRR